MAERRTPASEQVSTNDDPQANATEAPSKDAQRDAIVLPEFEAKIADAQSRADNDAIASLTEDYTKARSAALKEQDK